MRCEEARQWLGAWHDGELSDAEGHEIEEHLATCPECAEEARSLHLMGSALALQRAAMPDGLEQRILSATGGETADATTGSSPRERLWTRLSVLRAVAATAVVAAGTGWLAATWFGQTSVDATAHEIVTAHLRSLVTDSTVQIATTDPHTVKPWFAGRVDFAPGVRDLSQDGFTLVGGRVDIIRGRRVGAAVYKRRLHLINVFMWPAHDEPSGRAMPQALTAQGYSLVHWTRNGVVYWAVSDLNARELAEFPSLL